MANRRPNNDWVGRCTCKDFHNEALLNIATDISERLQEIASILRCRNFLDIPRKLEAIKANTEKPKRGRPAKLRSVA